jgi:SOS response regulatory protein OraA/RecX
MVGRKALSAAVAKALPLLNRFSYTSKRLADKLMAKGVDAATASKAVEHLNSIGALDDSSYAEALVRGKWNQGKLAPPAIKRVGGSTVNTVCCMNDRCCVE